MPIQTLRIEHLAPTLTLKMKQRIAELSHQGETAAHTFVPLTLSELNLHPFTQYQTVLEVGK